MFCFFVDVVPFPPRYKLRIRKANQCHNRGRPTEVTHPQRRPTTTTTTTRTPRLARIIWTIPPGRSRYSKAVAKLWLLCGTVTIGLKACTLVTFQHGQFTCAVSRARGISEIFGGTPRIQNNGSSTIRSPHKNL